MEQIVTSLAHSSSFANSLVKPTIIKDVTLLSPGVWTGEDNRPTEYTLDGIRKGFENSDWTNMNLYLDHRDTKGSAVGHWIGFVRNVNMSGNELKGDLEVWHPLYSMFIKQAKAKFAVSATMVGTEHINSQTGNYDYKINSFKSMSIVDEPGCGNSWLPKMLSSPESGEKTVVSGTNEAQFNVTEDATKPEEINELANPGSEDKQDISNHNCKEVGKMTEENQKEKSIEKKEEKSLSESKESSEDVKSLTAKIDQLTEVVTSISETVKSLAAEKESEEESEKESEEEKKEVVEETNADVVTEKAVEDKSETPEEATESSKELEDTKKELAAAKKKIVTFEEETDSPDQKTLAGVTNVEESSHDANAGMLGFLRETANISIY